MGRAFFMICFGFMFNQPVVAQFTDNFADGNFTNNPTWAGHDTKFEINGAGKLHLNAPAITANAYLSLPSMAIENATWEFYVEIGEIPSTTNFTNIYLAGSQANLSGALNGYYVKVGGASREVSLFRQDGNASVKIIDGADNRVNIKPVMVRIKATRDAAGNWELLSDNSGGTTYISEGTATDNTYKQSAFFGVFCEYTSTRSDKFYFDDFLVSGNPFTDNEAPQLSTVEVLSADSLRLQFSEALDSASAENASHYEVEGIHPSTAALEINNRILLRFATPFANGTTHTLTVSQVADTSGNVMPATARTFTYFEAVPPAFRNIIINEIFPDPNPQVGTLPADADAEFIELFNNSGHPFDLQGWKINSTVLPSFILLSGQYVILCKNSYQSSYSTFGNVIGLASWPTLSNSGATLLLKDAGGTTIDSLLYTGNQVKEGYSLELVQPNPPCVTLGNLAVSTHPNGATPGGKNAVFNDSPDTISPNLVKVMVDSVNRLTLHFDEALEETARNQLENYSISGGIGVGNVRAEAQQSQLTLATNLEQGKNYTASVANVTDCSGNPLAKNSFSFRYDVLPPVIAGIIVLDTSKIEVFWDEPVTKTPAEKEENYTVDQNMLKPSSAIWNAQRPQNVSLTFSRGFGKDINYQLSVINVSDTLGNTIPATKAATFTFSYKNQVDSVVVIDGNLLEVYFSAPVSEASAENIANYSIDKNVGQPGVAILSENQRRVTLIFGRNFSENKTQVLTLRNIRDSDDVLLSTPAQRFVYDTQAPKITGIKALSANTLTVTFDEEINRKSAEKTANYQISGFGNPATARLQEDGKTVVLTFSQNFAEEINYQLSVTGIADLKNNKITSPKSGTFIYDQRPPSIAKLVIVSPQQIRLLFSEPIHPGSAQQADFFQADQNIGQPDAVVLSKARPQQLDLFFSTAFQDDKNYTLTVHGVQDLAGNVIANPISLTFSNRFPSLAEIVPLSETEVRLHFSKPISKETAENANNYILDDGQKPVLCAINQEKPAEVSLVFDKSFIQKKVHHLSIENISDAQGNIAAMLNDSFVYDTKVKAIRMAGSAALQIDFTVPLQISAAQTILNFEVDEGFGNPIAAILNENSLSQITLYFPQNFVPNTAYALRISNLYDTLGQSIPSSVHRFGTGEKPGFNDLLITEIMADPAPPLGLPEADYLEIYNPTQKVVQLQGIQLSDATTTTYLPNALLQSGEYAILCASADVDDFSVFGKAIGVSNFPSLNNAGDDISLHNEDGELIFRVSYTDNWYKDLQKKQGGWSLEMLDISRPCAGQENWTASEDGSGGTPGRENSVKISQPDMIGPQLINALAASDTVVQLTFNENLRPGSIFSGKYFLSPAILIDTVKTGKQLNQVMIYLEENLIPKTAYTIRAADVADCNGNLISPENNSFTFYLPEAADSLDVLLNELLFAPRSGGKKFVELYNHSDKHINLRDWKLANITGDSVSNFKPVTIEDFILPPGEFLVLTDDAKILQADYPQTKADKVLEMPTLPSYPVSGGVVVLVNDRDEVVQIFEYDEDLHFSLLKDTKGVSLERISWEDKVNDDNNWHSAAASAGYATPGFMNSQYRKYGQVSAKFEVEPKVFSPDQSGTDDFTSIRYQFDAPGNVATISIFDAAGRKVKDLLQNATLSTADAIQWDGTDNHRQKVKIGYYLIYIEVFNLNGERQIFKEKVVVAGRF